MAEYKEDWMRLKLEIISDNDSDAVDRRLTRLVADEIGPPNEK